MLLDALIPYIQTDIPSVPDNVALLALRDCSRRFLRKVKIWTAELTLSSVADQAAYALDVSGEVAAGTTPTIYRIQYVTVNGTEISPSGYTLRATDEYLVFETDRIPGASDTDDIVVTVVLMSAFDGTDFPQWLIEKYLDAIVGGALSYLLKTPSRPYYNPSASRLYKLEYNRGIVQARMDLDSEGTERGGNYVISSKNFGGTKA